MDVTLCVDQSEFPCHKSVLAASSPYFMAMFSTNLAEGGLNSITLKDMEAATLELVLDYVYTGQVWCSGLCGQMWHNSKYIDVSQLPTKEITVPMFL